MHDCSSEFNSRQASAERRRREDSEMTLVNACVSVCRFSRDDEVSIRVHDEMKLEVERRTFQQTISRSSKRIMRQLSRAGERETGASWTGEVAIRAAGTLRKDCREKLPFIRNDLGAADKLLLHVRSPLHRD